MGSALQLDALKVSDWGAFKRAFTPKAVRQIHEAVIRVWPPDTDLSRVLGTEPSAVRALYVGEYEAPLLARAVSRHSLYADRITLVDPFVYAIKMRPEYSPLEYPEHFLMDSIRWAKIWFQFMEWVDQGLIEFIRTPGDFDPVLFRAIHEAEQARFAETPELHAMATQFADERSKTAERDDFARQALLLAKPDALLLKEMSDFDPSMSEELRRRILEEIHRQREEHPFHVDMVPDKDGRLSQMHMMTTGMGHLESRLAAALLRGYLVTDIKLRWRMIEMDREYEKIDAAKWSPLAKAISETKVRYLDAVDLRDALRLRQEDRLQNLRGFLRKICRDSTSLSPYSDAVAADLAAELATHVAEAERAWNDIDRDLARWAGAEAVIAGAGIVTGGASWVAGGLALAGAGVVNLAVAAWQRRDFDQSMPAGFFMDLQKRAERE